MKQKKSYMQLIQKADRIHTMVAQKLHSEIPPEKINKYRKRLGFIDEVLNHLHNQRRKGMQ